MAKNKSQPDVMRSSGLLSAYRRARQWRLAMLVIFGIVFAGTLAYATPFVPGGLTVEDYHNSRLTPLLALVLGAATSAFGAFYMRDRSNRLEQTLLTWNSVHTGLSDLRGRQYFYERVAIECQRAESVGSDFSVVHLRLPAEQEGTGRIELALTILRSAVRENDCLAALGPSEVGVLAQGVGNGGAEVFARRLCKLIAATDPKGEEEVVHCGWAIYHTDSEDASVLMGLARERLQASVQAGNATARPPSDSTQSVAAA